MPAGSTVHLAVPGGEPGITLKVFVHCCISPFAVVFVNCHVEKKFFFY